MFASSIGTSGSLSKELGDYDYIEVINTHGGGTDFGNLGLHFGANDTIQTSTKREMVVRNLRISVRWEIESFMFLIIILLKL